MSKLLSIYWNIHINGKLLDLNRKKCIESIDFDELCDGSDTCTLSIQDPNYVFIDDNIFIEEATISVTIGWHGDTHQHTFTGYISAIDIDFPENGYPSMKIYCLDNSHKMNRKKNKRSWDNVTRAEVVEKIAREYGFKCVVERGYNFKKEETISQSDKTDIEFCEGLASEERDPFMCKLIGDTLYYVKKGILKDPVAELHYREYPHDIISFKPQINKETKKEEVTASDINTNDKTIDTATANNNTPRDTAGEPVDSGNTSTVPVNEVTYNTQTREWE